MFDQMIEWLAMFYVYAFLGWCTEVIYAAFRTGKFVNRGFLNGPVCPIYGFGVVGVIVALSPLSDHLWLLFLGAVVFTSALEFFTGWLLEKVFHAKWWDYSENRLNLKGYICLEFSLIWGVAATVVVRLIHPPVLGCIRALPRPLLYALEILFSVTILVDLAASIAKARHLEKRLRLLCRMAGEIHDISDRIGDTLSDGVIVLRNKSEEHKEQYAPYDALCREHREQEKLLYEQHAAEEKKLLESLRSPEGEASTSRIANGRDELNRRRGEWQLRLRETKSAYHRLLSAFPTLKWRGEQGKKVMEDLRDTQDNALPDDGDPMARALPTEQDPKK